MAGRSLSQKDNVYSRRNIISRSTRSSLLRIGYTSTPRDDYGAPILRHLTDADAIAKYKISPRYIPELKLRPEETVIDSYAIIERDNLSLEQ